MTPLATFYGLDVALLTNEFPLAKRVLKDKETVSTLDVFNVLSSLSAAFPTLKCLIQIALTTVAECERSFSALKSIKTHLRTTMREERLTDITILLMERDLADKISLDQVLHDFEDTDKNRSIILS